MTMSNSYKYEVSVHKSWSGNGLRFATHDEADAAGRELLSRWWVPDEYRVVESSELVNYRFNPDTGKPEALPLEPLLSEESIHLLEECGV